MDNQVKKDVNTETKSESEPAVKAESTDTEPISKEELEKLISELESEIDEGEEGVKEESEEDEEEELEEEEEESEEEEEDEEEKSMDVEELYVDAEELLKSFVDEINAKNASIEKKLETIKRSLEAREHLDRLLAKTLKNLGKVIEAINSKDTFGVTKKSISETEKSKLEDKSLVQNLIMDMALKGELQTNDVINYEISGRIPDKVKAKLQ